MGVDRGIDQSGEDIERALNIPFELLGIKALDQAVGVAVGADLVAAGPDFAD